VLQHNDAGGPQDAADAVLARFRADFPWNLSLPRAAACSREVLLSKFTRQLSQTR
jgi:hypothetical protein